MRGKAASADSPHDQPIMAHRLQLIPSVAKVEDPLFM
jgi:hypothetical protein